MDKEKSKSKAFTYQEQHAVIVKVATEAEQKKVFEQLRKLGFVNIKIVSV